MTTKTFSLFVWAPAFLSFAIACSDRSHDFTERGASKGAQGDYKGAISDFDEALKLNPNDKDAYFFRGEARDRSNNYEGAIEDFTKYINLAPSRDEGYFRRGRAKAAKDDFAGALSDYNLAAQLVHAADQKFESRDNLTQSEELARIDEAKKLASEQLEKHPSQQQSGRSQSRVDAFASSILALARDRDISGLMEITVRPDSDMKEITRNYDRFGLPPRNMTSSQLKEWESATKRDLSIFLRSYGDLLDQELAATAEKPNSRLLQGSINTQSSVVNGTTIYGHLEPLKIVLWVKTSHGFSGIYVPEVYKIGTVLKVNSWVTDSPADGELVKERAVLVAEDIQSCTFPEVIKWQRAYR